MVLKSRTYGYLLRLTAGAMNQSSAKRVGKCSFQPGRGVLQSFYNQSKQALRLIGISGTLSLHHPFSRERAREEHVVSPPLSISMVIALVAPLRPGAPRERLIDLIN